MEKRAQWRFNVKYDPYAAKAVKESGSKSTHAFYGPLAKNLPHGDLKGVTDKNKTSLKNKAKYLLDHIWIHQRCQIPNMIPWVLLPGLGVS